MHGFKERATAYNLKVVIYDIADRCVATYFPEANNLIALDSFDPQCGIPAHKNIPVILEKASAVS